MCDLLFDRVAGGADVDVEQLCRTHPHLRAEVDELLRIALEVVPPRRSLSDESPRIRGYEIERELGRGEMGRVWLARQLAAGGRRVALKVLPETLASSALGRRRFLREAHTLARLRHPNVVAIHDVIADDAVCAYSMEWVDGSTLAELLERLRRIPEGERARLDDLATLLPDLPIERNGAGGHLDPLIGFFIRTGIATARALAATHAVGVVHRDVKPSNLLLRRDGSLVLCDFGLVRDAEATLRTQAGVFIGTAAYAAPEQLRGDAGDIDARTDVWGLGVTLYEALTRRLPYGATTQSGMLRQIEAGTATSPRRSDPRIPRDVEAVVAGAMEPERARRYPSAAAVADDLERVLRAQPIRVRRVGWIPRALRMVRRNRRVALAALASALVVASLAVLMGLELRHRARIPDEIARTLASARLSLLDPAYGDHSFAAVLGVDRPHRFSLARIDAALEDYDLALALDPERADVRSERATVGAARALAETLALPAEAGARRDSSRFKDLGPLTERFIRDWGAAGVEPRLDPRDLVGADGKDLAALGLVGFLGGAATPCAQAWTALAVPIGSEPLVDAALGLLYLAEDDVARSWLRLHAAVKAFPQAGFLLVDAADAAVRGHECAEALRLLRRSRGAQRLDPFETRLRVLADYLAECGELHAAGMLYERMLERHTAPTAQLGLARVLLRQGETLEGLARLGHLAAGDIADPRYRREFFAAVESWWAGLSIRARSDLVDEAIQGSRRPRPGASRGASADLFDVAWLYAAAVRRARAGEISAIGRDADSSVSVANGTFGGFVMRLEQRPVGMRSLNAFTSSSRTTAEELVDPEGSGNRFFGRLFSGIATATAVGLQAARRVATPIAATLLASAGLTLDDARAQSGGWTSAYGNAENSRRAAGQHLGSNWVERWRLPVGRSLSLPDVYWTRPLAKNGVVVLQTTTTRNEFSGIDLMTGISLWTLVLPDSASPTRRCGCIVGDRVFIESSTDGVGCTGGFPSRITCVELATGRRIWTWDSGIDGSVTNLQGYESSLPGASDRVIANIYDVNPCVNTLNMRTITFDPYYVNPTQNYFFGASGPYLTEFNDSTWLNSWSDAPPAVYAQPSGGGGYQFHVLLHHETTEIQPAGDDYESWQVRDHDLFTMTKNGFHPLSGVSLSTLDWDYSGCPFVVDANDGVIYETGGFLRCYDLTSSMQRWGFPITTTWKHLFPLFLGTQVVVPDLEVNKDFTAFDRNTGAFKWTAVPPAAPITANPVFDGDRVMVALDDGGIWALDPSGRWFGPIDRYSSGAVVLAADGAVIGYELNSAGTWDWVCRNSTSPLVLGINVFGTTPWVARAGDTVELDLFGGVPFEIGLLVLTALDHVPTFVPMLPLVKLDGAGEFVLSGAVPPGISGHDLEFVFHSLATPNGVWKSNPATLSLR